MKLKFIPLDYDYFDLGNESSVRLWGRSDEGKRICVIDSCDDFFWVIPKQNLSINELNRLIEKIKVIKSENAGRKVYVKKVEQHKKNFLGKQVRALKLVVSNPKDKHFISEIVKQYHGVEMKREIDIPFITRYIIEKDVLPLHWYAVDCSVVDATEFSGIANALDVDFVVRAEKITASADLDFKPNVMAFDIEADSLEIGKGKILMISIVAESGRFKKVLTWKKVKNLHASGYVELCEDEKDMLAKFCQYIKEKKPDILVGYFSDGFDMPYLRARAEKNKIKLDIGLDGSQPVFARGRISSAKLTGIVHIDLFRFIETVYSQYLQSETLSLDEVSSELLGERKHEFGKEHRGKEADGLKEHEWQQYFAYNLQDSILTEKLFHKLWPDLLEFTKITQEPLFSVSRDSFSQHVENYIVHNLKRFNEIAEHRPTHEQIQARRSRERYGGAFVLQPRVALYENLAVFDFTSLYPSIIVSFNISGASLIKNPDKLLPKNAFRIDDVELGNKKQTLYFSKKPSFIPILLGEVIKRRKEVKRMLKQKPTAILNARSNAFKTLANATYGYFGFFGARYYCVEAAAATAALGRKFIHKMIDKTNNAGFEVIYADTDGFAFSLCNKNKADVVDFLKRLNAELPGMMELELEDFYRRGIFVTKRTGEFGAKKKYALLNEKGKLKVRGFETVRRDWCELARKVQNKVLEKSLHEGNADSALRYVQDIIKKIKEREIEKKELIIRTQLKKPISEYKTESPHVSIAKKMVEAGLPVDVGMLIEFYIAESKGNRKKSLIRERAKLPDEQGRYDVDYYINNQIIPAVENIFAVFGISREDIISGKKQKKLLEF
jgi:DNA polymerase I/DNA polymerase-2